MKFNEAELEAIQQPRSAHYELSATFSASLTMENDGRICAAIDAKRRIDGTVTAADVKAIFNAMDVQVDEWAIGPLNVEILAANFNEDREPVAIPDVVRESLISMKFDGDSAALVQQLDRNDYNKVNKILEALGGKWNKKAGNHVFAGCDPEEAVANYLATGKLDKPEKFGFFPTPAPLARELVRLAGLRPGDIVLEPEAGVGGIAIICAEVVGQGNVTCYEIQQKNCDVLRSLGFNVQQADFLSIQPHKKFTHAILNPPFENQADISHVMHAFSFVEPGGTIAAIMSIGVTFRTNRKTTQFRAFLDSMGAKIIVNDRDAFKESGTTAQTVSVIFSRPSELPATELHSAGAALPDPEPVLALVAAAQPEPQAIAIPAINQRKPAPEQCSFAF